MILQSIKLIKSNILVDELDEVTVSLKSEKNKRYKAIGLWQSSEINLFATMRHL